MNSKPGVIYFVKSNDTIKIGYTTSLLERLKEATTWSAETTVVLGIIPGNRSMEMTLHKTLKPYKTQREHFQPHRDVLSMMAILIAYSKLVFGVGMNQADWLRFVEKQRHADDLEGDIKDFEMWQRFESSFVSLL